MDAATLTGAEHFGNVIDRVILNEAVAIVMLLLNV
jgi:hypothetical protein